MAMDPALKAKWVEALRSGEFKQARGQLHKDGAFCCLGVLCRIEQIEIAKDGIAVQGYADSATLGYEQIWKLVDEWTAKGLSAMNDDGTSFPEIADFIEASL